MPVFPGGQRPRLLCPSFYPCVWHNNWHIDGGSKMLGGWMDEYVVSPLNIYIVTWNPLQVSESMNLFMLPIVLPHDIFLIDPAYGPLMFLRTGQKTWFNVLIVTGGNQMPPYCDFGWKFWTHWKYFPSILFQFLHVCVCLSVLIGLSPLTKRIEREWYRDINSPLESQKYQVPSCKHTLFYGELTGSGQALWLLWLNITLI